MGQARIIGEVSGQQGYDGLHALFRARSEALAIVRNDLDALSGLADGYVAKLLSPVQMKSIGRLSLGPLMSALAVKLVMVEDVEMLARIERKIGRQIRMGPPRAKQLGERPQAKRKQYPQRYLRKGNSDWGRMMRARQLLTQSPGQRKRIARIARRSRGA